MLKPDSRAVKLAEEANLKVLSNLEASELNSEIAKADIVQYHFWNNVEIHAAIVTELPPMRCVVWCHVNGLSPPHIITPTVCSRADRIVASTALTLELENFQLNSDRVRLIAGGADMTRVQSVDLPCAHKDFTIGYIGALDVAKLHPDFIEMSARLDVSSARFLIYGSGPSMRSFVSKASLYERRFEFRGYVHDIASEIKNFDVFGYPLCEDNSTTSELILQEVMYSGIPPVVLPHGGAANLVIHKETGLVARDPSDYALCLKYLFDYPEERLRLGRNAAQWAYEKMGSGITANAFSALYSELLKEPKRYLPPASLINPGEPESPNFGGALCLLSSLDGSVPELIQAYENRNSSTVNLAERAIKNLPPGIGDIIIHYRTRFANDSILALWTGIVFQARLRHALALSEFKRSLNLGNKHAEFFLLLATARD